MMALFRNCFSFGPCWGLPAWTCRDVFRHVEFRCILLRLNAFCLVRQTLEKLSPRELLAGSKAHNGVYVGKVPPQAD